MRLKKVIKRIVALGAGATMLGATIMGAMAADLADYPKPFVKDGVWQSDALIAFGTNAAASDVAGAVDLAVALQYAARTKKTVSTAAAGAITVSGDAKKIVSGSNHLEFNESVRGIRTSVTSADLTALADGSVSNEYGTPTYTQTISLPQNARLVFDSDSDHTDQYKALPYLKITSSSSVVDQTYKYEISFSPYLKSDHHAAGSSYLEDIRNKKMKILGTDYSIITADHSAQNQTTLTFMAGAVSDTISEGETKTYTIDGTDYEVTLDYVGTADCKFTVNGETTLALAETETHRLSGGLEVGVVDIMAQEFAGGLRKVEFNLGANKLKCTDTNTMSSTNGGTVTIGSEDMSSMKCEIITSKDDGTAAGADVEITTINFKYSAGSDLYLAAGEGADARAELAEVQAGNFLNKAFDFKFEGLEVGKTEEIELTSSGSYNYKLKFTNKAGVAYNQEVIAYDTTASAIKFGSFTGSTMRDLESNEINNIADDEFFVVSKNEYSRIMQFKDIVPGASATDNVGTVRLKDVGTGDMIDVAYSETARNGTLRLDGNEFRLNVSADANTGDITVDFDGDGNIRSAAWCPQLFSQYGANITLCGWRNATGAGGFIDPGYGENTLAIITETLEGGSDREIILMGVILNADSKIDLNDSAHVRSSIMTGSSYDTTAMKQKDDGSYVYQWYSKYGVFAEVDRIGSGNTQNKFKAVYPDEQMFGAFFVTAGKTTASSVEAGEGVVTYYETNPISVGMAKLASEVDDLTAYNLVLVGGPCANEAARSIMGVSEAACLEGFEPGKALLKIYDNDGKIALLVAGYSADDTKKATTVLANYDQYTLSGTEMEVTGTSLSELTVAAPTPEEATE